MAAGVNNGDDALFYRLLAGGNLICPLLIYRKTRSKKWEISAPDTSDSPLLIWPNTTTALQKAFYCSDTQPAGRDPLVGREE